MIKNNEKKAYKTPQLTVHGDVAEVTKALAFRPTQLDGTFPNNTPFSQLKFT